MVSKLYQLKAKANQVTQLIAKHGTEYYKKLLEENKQYIQEPPTPEKCNLLSKQLFYTRLASHNAVHPLCCIPLHYKAFWKELDYVKHKWRHVGDLKVEDVAIATLFGLECYG
ncbi:uncharacterized protein LOC115749110 [Rhodamnia argentea]|uniref:Uncharacterized protein LOC115749110 n=1 Tax=Rhodamnia argentea TaxID=178133 RepID=A0A8B8Q3M0_9MYRT|nr:uncharacterized protein LOC115749110 [Rhodamnia argentea]